MYLQSSAGRAARYAVAAGSHLTLLNALFVGIGIVFSAMYALLGSYGLSIIVLGAGITALSTPLVALSWRTQVARARLAPQLDELNRRHRHDRQRLSAECAALFKRHGISPWSGCLPALLPAPVYLALYQVLRGLTHRQPGGWHLQPRYIPHGSRLLHSLASSTTIRFLGVDLARNGAAALQLSAYSGVLFVVLVAFIVIAGVWQQHLVRSALPRPSAPAGAVLDRASLLLPALFAIWALVLPLAVTLYYASASVVRLAQHWYLVKVHPF